MFSENLNKQFEENELHLRVDADFATKRIRRKKRFFMKAAQMNTRLCKKKASGRSSKWKPSTEFVTPPLQVLRRGLLQMNI
jgi:uncharacterized protein (DUF2461 family)